MDDLEVPASTVVMPSVPAEHAAATLAEILETLGAHALQLVAEAGQLHVEVGESVVHGFGEPVTPTQGGLLLLTGNRVEDSRTVATVRAAGASGYRAVVLKTFDADLRAVREAAEEAGVALLTTPDEMAWRHLDTLVTASRSAVTSDHRDRFTSVGLGDLFALANAIAASLGGAVTIEEPTGRVIAYSNLPHHEIDEIRRRGILGRQTPERPTNYEEYQTVLRADAPVFFKSHSPTYASRLAVAVRAGAQALGLIWVLTDRPPLPPGAEAAITDAAKATAMHLLRARGQRDPERAHRTEALLLLLDGALNAGVAATRLGLPRDTTTVVLAVAPAAAQPEPLLAAARIVDLVSLYCESWHSSALCVADAGVVYAVLPVQTDVDPATRLMKLANDIVGTVDRSARLDVLVALGSLAPTLGDIPESRQLADRVLEVLAERIFRGDTQRRVASVEQVRGEVLLRAVAEQGTAAPDMQLATVRAILQHDAAHGTAYAVSVLAYLGAFGDVARAAARLNVHENTMRYRIRRAQSLFHLDLSDADQLLTTWLQLRLVEGASIH